MVKKITMFILFAVLSLSCSVVSFAEEDTEAANPVEIQALYAEFANIQASAPSPQNLGVTVKFTAVASGNSLQYRFTRIASDNTRTVFRDWNASTVAYCNPQLADSYIIVVEARDDVGYISEMSMPYTWIDPNAPTEPPLEPSLPSGDVGPDDFMIGVNWIFSAMSILWNWLISLGFIGYCVIGVLVVQRVAKLVRRALHK